jgi:threonine aldolase
MIDLRSDTVTKPTPAMRQAMFEAEVGDDVYGEDPTVNALEQSAAELFAKEAALFVPTGTMGNTIAIKMHTQHGQEVICDSRSHILNYELSMMAWFAGCVARAIPTDNGILTWDRIAPEVRPLGPHWAPTGLIEIENTHNMAGGTIYPLETIRDIGAHAHERGLKVHMDGARVFHSAEALGVDVAEIAAPVDSVMFCLSKGLGAPAGSMLVGTRTDIDYARLLRKRLGGGMRQAGILAAAGQIALGRGPMRLQEDHSNARLLADRLAAIKGIALDPARIQTNIVIFDTTATGIPAPELSRCLKSRGVLMNAINSHTLRAVTHYDVSRSDCMKAAEVLAEVVGKESSVLAQSTRP